MIKDQTLDDAVIEIGRTLKALQKLQQTRKGQVVCLNRDCKKHHKPFDNDLGRCLRLLEQIPEWKPRIKEMAVYGPGWSGQVEHCEELAATMADEVGIDWSKGKRAPVTFNAMQLAQAAGYRNDPSYRSTFNKDGHLSSAMRVTP